MKASIGYILEIKTPSGLFVFKSTRLKDYKSEKGILILAPTFDGRQTRKRIEKRPQLLSLDFDLLMCSIKTPRKRQKKPSHWAGRISS
jgi:hypothetical protein